MESPWTLCGMGLLFCAGGVYSFHKNAFEDDKNLWRPILLLIAGVVLIGMGLAKLYL